MLLTQRHEYVDHTQFVVLGSKLDGQLGKQIYCVPQCTDAAQHFFGLLVSALDNLDQLANCLGRYLVLEVEYQ